MKIKFILNKKINSKWIFCIIENYINNNAKNKVGQKKLYYIQTINSNDGMKIFIKIRKNLLQK